MANLPRGRLSQEPPFTYSGIDMFGPILVKEGGKEMKMGIFSHDFQAEQFILNLQIHYLLVPSYKYFKDLYQEEVMYESSEPIMAQILLGPRQN